LQYNVDERNIDLDDNILPENLIQDLATIEKKPIKSASIALVYSGLLKNGDKIAIKIVKQN
jgi:predicted unusual protein kinase regulating ubiquinone biosynthesis (AarF/ABC1/UbiB family)